MAEFLASLSPVGLVVMVVAGASVLVALAQLPRALRETWRRQWRVERDGEEPPDTDR